MPTRPPPTTAAAPLAERELIIWTQPSTVIGGHSISTEEGYEPLLAPRSPGALTKLQRREHIDVNFGFGFGHTEVDALRIFERRTLT